MNSQQFIEITSSLYEIYFSNKEYIFIFYKLVKTFQLPHDSIASESIFTKTDQEKRLEFME